MGDTDTDMIHRLHSPFNTSIPKQPQQQQHQLELNPKRVGVPPTSPYSQIQSFNQGGGASHSRSMSQPSSFFSFDSLPPLSPSPFMEDRGDSRVFSNNASSLLPPSHSFTRCNSTTTSSSRDTLPPRKSHRRSNSDIPTGLSSIPLIPPRPLERSVSGGESADWSKTNPFVKKEGVGEREAMPMDDLFSAYMNLENIDSLNSSENNNRDEMESSRASGTKTSDDTEGETSSVSGNSHSNLKRRAGGGDIAPTTRHYRSVSVDSCFMEKLSFGDDSVLKPPPSPGTTVSRKVSPTSSADGGGGAAFSIEFKNGEFTAAEMKKIMANDKLAEMAVADPKRVKRILANRQSAARSKERKMRYIVELEHKVQTLQTEATTLSAQLTLLQRDMMGLTNQNNELKFRLQSMEQQARLRDALNEALNGEVQRLKLAIGESSNHNEEADRSKMHSLNAEMFQQLNISQLRQQQPQSQSTKPESNE
ncbi:unnamed protein product [Eruca vesicaria subsp. sativa]|uniref:BZIP domain-containing protein n=1 Tax=Eruca vesicaria subsp. sativa TaxID=29727 RepID=A0ABC8J5B8_ERUVS|nr:unnamed protein product [Eruca vesicaria subsp. sativa]